CQQHNYYPWTF
nr:immunoglobulin light chain junction region [Macaca mulatta]